MPFMYHVGVRSTTSCSPLAEAARKVKKLRQEARGDQNYAREKAIVDKALQVERKRIAMSDLSIADRIKKLQSVVERANRILNPLQGEIELV